MYESPIQLYLTDIQTQIVDAQEETILKAVQNLGVNVDREELIRALKYDREQYARGYNDAMESIVRCKDCRHYKPQKKSAHWNSTVPYCCRCTVVKVTPDDFCSYGERKDNATD